MGDLTYCEGNGTATAHGSPIDLTIFEKNFLQTGRSLPTPIVHAARQPLLTMLTMLSSIDTSTKRNSFTIIDKPEKK